MTTSSVALGNSSFEDEDVDEGKDHTGNLRIADFGQQHHESGIDAPTRDHQQNDPEINLAAHESLLAKSDLVTDPSHPPFRPPRMTGSRVSRNESGHLRPYQLLCEWFWELLTWLLGTLSLFTIVILLKCFNRKLLSEWNSVISINTIVSVLSQTVVSALLVSVSSCISQMKWVWYQKENDLVDIDMFDLASRGPQGSLRLLFSSRRVL